MIKRGQLGEPTWTRGSRAGCPCKAYAAKAGINQRTLTWWKSKLASGRAGPALASFVEVTEQLAAPAVAEAGVVELDVGGVHVRVRGRVEAEALARVLDVLEAKLRRPRRDG